MTLSSLAISPDPHCRGMSAQGDLRWAPRTTAIRLEPAWLGAELEHRRDQAMLRALLDDMARTGRLDRFAQLLDAALENELLRQPRHRIAPRPQRALLRTRGRVLTAAATLLRNRS